MQFVVFAVFAISLLFSGYTPVLQRLNGRKLFVESNEDFEHLEYLMALEASQCRKVASFRVNLLGVYRNVQPTLTQSYPKGHLGAQLRVSLDGKKWKNCSYMEHKKQFMVSVHEKVRWIDVIIPKSVLTCSFYVYAEIVHSDYDPVPRSDIVGSELTALFDGDTDKPADIQWSPSSPIEIVLNRTYFITQIRFYMDGTSPYMEFRDMIVEYETRNGTKLFGSNFMMDRMLQIFDDGGFLHNKVASMTKIIISMSDNNNDFKGEVREIQLFGAPNLAWQWEKFVATGDSQELVREKNDSIDECFVQCMGFKHFAIINGSTCQCQEDTRVPQQHTKSTVVFSPPEIIGCLPPDRINIYGKRQMQLGRSDTTHTCFTYCSGYRFVGLQKNRVCLCLEVEEHQLQAIKDDCGILCETNKEMGCLSKNGTNVIKMKEPMQNSSDQHEGKMSYWKFMAILVGAIIPGCVILFCLMVSLTVYVKEMYKKRHKYGMVPSITTSSSISESQKRSSPQNPKQPDPDELYLPYRIVPLPRNDRSQTTTEPSCSSEQDKLHKS